MLNSFKDVNGTKVVVGEVVSIIGKNKEIMVVDSIQRSRRKIEVCLYSNLTGMYSYAPSKILVSEM